MFASCSSNFNVNQIKPSDNLVARTINVGDVTAVNASIIDVIITPAQGDGTATLTAPDNIIDLIDINNEGGNLVIKLKDNVNLSMRPDTKVELSAVVGNITANVSSKVVVKGDLDYAGVVDLTANTAATIEMANVKCAGLDITVNTAAQVNLGDATIEKNTQMTANTAATINVANIYGQNLGATVNTAGSINISGGEISYMNLTANTGSNLTCGATAAGGSVTTNTGANVRCHTSGLNITNNTGGNTSEI